MKSTERFSDRVENYQKYRPHYPLEIISFLKDEIGLLPTSVLGDIGSGTGISSELFLQNGNTVYAVEPNKEMREAAEIILSHYPQFHSISGAAEATTLESKSIDFIIAGQAFHWFDVEKTRVEFKRILKSGGFTVLIWNERKLDTTPFLLAYEKLLHTFGTDYAEVQHRNSKHYIQEFFGEKKYASMTFPNIQVFNFESLKGRLLSSSYTPTPESPKYQPMLEELQRIFDLYQKENGVEILYDTDIYFGQLI